METKITLATVRIALSHAYSTFEISAQLENPEGINTNDIEKARKDCQSLASASVAEYKAQPNANPKVELQRVENKLAEIKKMVEKQPEKVDPIEVAKIEKLPLYSETKGNKKAK